MKEPTVESMGERKKHNALSGTVRARIFCVVFVCLVCVAAEITARFAFQETDTLSQILSVLERDPVLLWRLRSHLHTLFQGAALKTGRMGLRIRDTDISVSKKKGNFRIVCLGGSPTFGWGLEIEESYPFRLELFLKQKYPQGPCIEVINAGVIGYSSYQGLQFLKRDILKLAPDLITIEYLANDIDKYRFFRNDDKSDKETGVDNTLLAVSSNLLERSAFFTLLRRVLTRRTNTRLYGTGTQGYKDKRRVSEQEYKDNLIEIIRLAREKGIKVIFLKMKVALPFEPQEITSFAKGRAEKHISRSRLSVAQGDYLKAIFELEQAVALYPYSNKAFYYLGQCYSKVGKMRISEQYFQKAKELELLECAIISRSYNRAMQEVAERHGVPLVDTVSLFDGFAKKHHQDVFINPGYDVVHLNSLGHALISETLADIIVQAGYIPSWQQDEIEQRNPRT